MPSESELRAIKTSIKRKKKIKEKEEERDHPDKSKQTKL